VLCQTLGRPRRLASEVCILDATKSTGKRLKKRFERGLYLQRILAHWLRGVFAASGACARKPVLA